MVGMGVTGLFDGLGRALTAEQPDAGWLFTGLALLFSVMLSWVVILFGLLGRKPRPRVVLAGIVLYGLDALLVLVDGDFLAVLFHAYALAKLMEGYRAYRQLAALSPEAAAQPLAPALREPPPPVRSSRGGLLKFRFLAALLCWFPLMFGGSTFERDLTCQALALVGLVLAMLPLRWFKVLGPTQVALYAITAVVNPALWTELGWILPLVRALALLMALGLWWQERVGAVESDPEGLAST
jgi:hypothetical protein